MSLILFGINHKTAPVSLREKFSLAPQRLKEEILRWKQELSLAEILMLSTCNRFEVYAACSEEDGESARLRERFTRAGAGEVTYHYREPESVSHLFQVACGLDSMVVGEGEILSQVKEAYRIAHEARTTDKRLNVLFQRAIFVGKEARTKTGIGMGNISVGSVAATLALKIFGNLSKKTVLVAGAGKMSEKALKHLLSFGPDAVYLVNRTFENAQELAARFGGVAVPWEKLEEAIFACDIAILSTGAEEFIITREQVMRRHLKAPGRALFLIDISVPRNVEPSIGSLDNVYLYNIDDLQAIADENLGKRQNEVAKAAAMVSRHVEEFMGWYQSLGGVRETSLKHRP